MISKFIDKLSHAQKNPGTVLSSALIVTATGLATRQVVTTTWRAVNGEEPPRDPSHPDVNWTTALAWTTAVGVTVGLARLLARRVMHTDPKS